MTTTMVTSDFAERPIGKDMEGTEEAQNTDMLCLQKAREGAGQAFDPRRCQRPNKRRSNLPPSPFGKEHFGDFASTLSALIA